MVEFFSRLGRRLGLVWWVAFYMGGFPLVSCRCFFFVMALRSDSWIAYFLMF